MSIKFLTPLCMMLAAATSSPHVLTDLERAIWHVETNQCPADCPKGDGGKAIGPLQIHRACFSDVARPGEKYEDCKTLAFSVKVFRRYMDRYATESRLGRKPSDEDKARIWNGGPRGPWASGKKKQNLDKYWAKTRAAMEARK